MAETIQKKRGGRPKKTVVEEAVVLINEPTETPSVRGKGVRKATTKVSAKPATTDDIKPATTRKPRASTKKSSENVDNSIEKPTVTNAAAANSTTKGAKTSTSEETLAAEVSQVSPTSSTPIKTKSTRSTKSTTVNAPSPLPIAEASRTPKPASAEVDRVQSSLEQEVPVAPEQQPASQPTSQESQPTVATPPPTSTNDSKFLSSFLNDPEPAPSGGTSISLEEEKELRKNEVPPPHSSKARAAAAKRARAEQQVAASSDHPQGSTPLENPVAGGDNPAQDQIDTMMRIRAYGAQSFATLRAQAATSGDASSSNARISGSKSSNPSSKPVHTLEATSTPEAPKPSIPQPTQTTAPQTVASRPTAPSQPQATPPPPSSSASATTTKSTPPPRSATAASSSSGTLRSRQPLPQQQPHMPPTPYQKPPPLRPTQLPHSELRKNPEFRRMSRRYTSLLIALPILIVTSGELWRRYEVQRAERIAQGLERKEDGGFRGAVDGFMARGGSVKGWGVMGGEGGMRNGGV